MSLAQRFRDWREEMELIREEEERGLSVYDFIVGIRDGDDEEEDNLEATVLTREDVLKACPHEEIENLEVFEVPEGTEVIGMEAFEGAEFLTEVIIPESVFMIQIDAFYGCTRLEKLQLPRELKCIDDGAFMECRSLEKIVIPPEVEVIGSEAFKNCTRLQRLVATGKALEEIEESAFENCYSLKSIRLGINVRYIRKRAFENCRRLEVVRFPHRGQLRSIESDAFSGTKKLRSIKLPESYRRCPPYGELSQSFNNSNIYFY